MSTLDLNPTTQLKKVPWYLWFAAGAVFLSPFYVFESGNPQPTDMLTCIFVFGVLVRHNGRLRFPRHATFFVATLMVLGIWIGLVNLFWSWFYLDPIILKPTSYYWFNFSVTIVFIGLFHEHGTRLHRGLVHLLFSTLLLQVLLSPFVASDETHRETLFFNNPNQLAYYAVCCSSILLAVAQRLRFGAVYQTIYYACCMGLVIMSVSRAGMAAISLLLVYLVWERPRFLFLIAGAMILTFWYASSFPEFFEYFQNRISDVGQNTDRGYGRVFEHPLYMIFGAGEWGGVHQFGETLELHSNFGTMIFCYGLFGLILYLVLHFELVRRLPPSAFFSLVPPMILGLSHKGLRFSLYWIHLAVLMTLWSSRLVYRSRQDDLDLENLEEEGRPPFVGWPVPGESRRRGRR